MNILNIHIGGFIFSLDHCGVFLRLPWIGDGWLDITGNGYTCWSPWRECAQ